MARSGFPGVEELLLGGRFRPLTDGLMFVFGSLHDVCAAFASRQWVSTWSATAALSLTDVLQRLEPLSIPHPRKMLLIPTVQDRVTAVFEDRLGSTDLALLAQVGDLGFDGVGVLSTPNDLQEISPGRRSGSYGGRQFSEVRADPSLGRGFEARTLWLLTESGRRWTLEGGEAPWSAVWDPEARRPVDRFTHEHVVASAAARGLRPFDEDFYHPSEAVLLEQVRETFEGEKWGTLAMAQGREPRVLRSYLTDPPPPFP